MASNNIPPEFDARKDAWERATGPEDHPAWPIAVPNGWEELKRVLDKRGQIDPTGKDLKEPGAKADAGKSPVMQGALHYFPRAILEVGKVSFVGAEKYSWKGWESVPDGVNRYGDALGRHMIYEAIDGPYDPETKLLHAAQVAWNALARLELILRENKE